MKPFYTLNFNARVCKMSVSVGGVPLIRLEVKGQCSSRIPFNNLLLESGYATIRYEALPLKGDLHLRKEAYLDCEVELYDLDTGNEPVSKMAHYESSPHDDKLLPLIVNEKVFPVTVPYTIVGWQKSVNLDRYENYIRTMVFNKYNSIIAMMKSRDFVQYESAFRDRVEILGTCFYMTKDKVDECNKATEELIINSSRIVPLSELDIIEYAAEKRLVRLIKTDGNSSLRVVNDEEEEETTIDLWLHIKPGSSQLTII